MVWEILLDLDDHKMKEHVKDIKLAFKLVGMRHWLTYYAPKPISYIGDFLDWILPYHSYHWLDKIKMTLNPRQKWIKKHIKWNRFCDKVELIPDFLFGCIIHFVEEEKAYEYICWDNDKERKKVGKELKEAYHYARYDRPALLDTINAEWKAMPIEDDWPPRARTETETETDGQCAIKDYKKRYGKVDKLENELARKDKKYTLIIVNHKDYMWV